jgi:UDP-N-acetylglucosamine 2-epimerase (non-hydrolysing)
VKPRRTLFLVVGTRPEIIKQAPLYFAAEQQGWRCVVCFTGQHRDLGRQMLNDLGVRADHELDLMQPAQTPADFLGVAVPAIAALLRRQRPDWVAVQGDTTTALAGALAGFYEKVPVLHVEAGLRTYNLRLPFPEEGHRQLIARLATAHAAPTAEAANALRREGIAADAILTCGNTGIDCLLRTVAMLRRHSGRLPRTLPPALAAQLAARDPRDEATPVVLVTMHRRESFGPALAGMCRAFRRLARKHPTACLVWPVHPNPAVRGPVHRLLGKLRNVHLIEPQPFTAFAWLLERCTFIATDSGGLQEEGPALGKPVLILREVTERPEAVACGSAELVGCGERAIYAAAMRLLEDRAVYRAMAIPRFPYGDGTAAVKIITWLARRKRP